MAAPSKLTQDKIDFIIQHHASMGQIPIARQIGVSKTTVYRAMKKLRLEPYGTYRKRMDEERKEQAAAERKAIELYLICQAIKGKKQKTERRTCINPSCCWLYYGKSCFWNECRIKRRIKEKAPARRQP